MKLSIHTNNFQNFKSQETQLYLNMRENLFSAGNWTGRGNSGERALSTELSHLSILFHTKQHFCFLSIPTGITFERVCCTYSLCTRFSKCLCLGHHSGCCWALNQIQHISSRIVTPRSVYANSTLNRAVYNRSPSQNELVFFSDGASLRRAVWLIVTASSSKDCGS